MPLGWQVRGMWRFEGLWIAPVAGLQCSYPCQRDQSASGDGERLTFLGPGSAMGTRLAMAAHPRTEGDDVDRRRVKLQLDLINAVVRFEAQRRDRKELAEVSERSTSLLDAVAVEIESEDDPELAALLATVRAAVDGLSAED